MPVHTRDLSRHGYSWVAQALGGGFIVMYACEIALGWLQRLCIGVHPGDISERGTF